MSFALPVFHIPRPPSLRIIIDCQSIFFNFTFSLFSPPPLFSYSFSNSLFTSFSLRCWQIRDFFIFFFSLPRARFLYLTISLELVLSTVNILPLSLHFLFPELFPPPRVVAFYLLNPTTITILARNSPRKSLSIL